MSKSDGFGPNDYTIQTVFMNESIPLETIGETSYVYYDSDASCTYVNDSIPQQNVALSTIMESSVLTEAPVVQPPESSIVKSPASPVKQEDKMVTCNLVKLTEIVNSQTMKAYSTGYNTGYSHGYSDALTITNASNIGVGISIGLVLSGVFLYFSKQ
jgi:hypothetical protein